MFMQSVSSELIRSLILVISFRRCQFLPLETCVQTPCGLFRKMEQALIRLTTTVLVMGNVATLFAPLESHGFLGTVIPWVLCSSLIPAPLFCRTCSLVCSYMSTNLFNVWEPVVLQHCKIIRGPNGVTLSNCQDHAHGVTHAGRDAEFCSLVVAWHTGLWT